MTMSASKRVSGCKTIGDQVGQCVQLVGSRAFRHADQKITAGEQFPRQSTRGAAQAAG